MILRALLAAIGVAELLRPRRFVDFWMQLAVEEGSDVELRPWVYTAARVEGVLLLAWALSRCGGDGSED